MEDSVRFLPCGDSAVTVEFGSTIDNMLNQTIHAFCGAVEGLPLPALREVVPTYRSATIHYDPEQMSYGELCSLLAPLAQSIRPEEKAGELIDIPVLYGGEQGPDLEIVAAHCGLSAEEVIRLHSAPDYRIFMLGFTPGFPYLGGMDPKLSTPRRKEPRTAIPAGSVGIAGGQTGIYPIVSPGGWQLIGRTPLSLFDPAANPPILLAAGKRIRFVPIDAQTFETIQKGGGRL